MDPQELVRGRKYWRIVAGRAVRVIYEGLDPEETLHVFEVEGVRHSYSLTDAKVRTEVGKNWVATIAP